MYAEHFGLKEPAFAITPDPRYIFLSERHREALAHLLYGAVEGGGFVQLTGEVGTGKTMLCRCLLEELPPHVDVALILNPKLTSLELLATVCDELGMPYPRETASTKPLIDALSAYLLGAHARGRRTVLIIDEAQDLSVEVLEQVRLLTNLETAREKLLQIILIGQPELLALLDREDLRQLAQRITARYHLTPFTETETRAYVRHRLQVAGRGRGIFSEAAVRAVHRHSGGVPRVINVLCDRALLGAFSQERTAVDSSLIERAAREVSGRPPTPTWRVRLRQLGSPAAAVVAAAVVGAILGANLLAARSSLPGSGSTAATPIVATNAEITPVTAASDHPRLAALLEESSGAGDRTAALAGVYARWGVPDAAAAARRGCEGALEAGFRCLRRTGGWSALRRYDLPAVVELAPPSGARLFAAVLGLSEDEATLGVDRRQMTAALAEIDGLWNGEFLVLWKAPPVGTLPLGPGARGPDVAWVRSRLAALGSGADLARTDVYDQDVRDRVMLFQRSRQLEPNGVIGEETLFHLSVAAPEGGVPHLSRPRS